MEDKGFIAPSDDNSDIEVVINKDSNRLQKLEPFKAWDGKELEDMPLLIKTKASVPLTTYLWLARG